MRIAIVGVGAMGSVYAALLASAGNEVIAVHCNPTHVDRIMAHGLRVQGMSGDRTVRIPAYVAAPPEPMDLVVIAVKAAQAGPAAKSAIPLCAKNTIVLAIQNGLGSSDAVIDALGGAQLIVGIADGFGAALVAPGHAYHNGMGVIRMGSYSSLDFAAVEHVASVWRAAGFTAEAVHDIAAMQWEKLICNVAYSALCALTGMTVGQVMDDPDAGPISRAAALETWKVGRANGIAIKIDDPVAHVRAFAARIPTSKSSLLQDHQARRPSEIDFINGAVPREARRVGMEAPVNSILTALIRAKERGFRL